MLRPFLLLFLTLFLPLAGVGAEILPPFGLDWGVSQERLGKMLTGSKATVVEKGVDSEGRERWAVEGLVQTNLKLTIFYFRNEGLAEVELQYSSPGWTGTEYNDYLGQLRQKLEQRYGTGRLLQRARSVEAGVVQILVGYVWGEGGNTQIKLVYFAAETPAQVYRTVSLHYKAVY